MTFSEYFAGLGELSNVAHSSSAVLLNQRPGPKLSQRVIQFSQLLQPISLEELNCRAQESAAITRRHFGRTLRLFAPLYLSNECINSCAYCGFSRENAILRVTLEIEEVLKEAQALADQGMRNILLVAGEHPKFVSNGYLKHCIQRLLPLFPSIALEVAPLETVEYQPLVHAGAEGLVVYQETYHPATYAQLHTTGPKKDFAWRLDCPERAYAAGFRRLGIGALFGLWDWRAEAIALAGHIDYLLKQCWKAQLTISLPRLRPAAGGFQPRFELRDAELMQLVFAFRKTFPSVGLVLSTREPAALRDVLAPLGITFMSAGSHTEPGGYTNQGRERLVLTQQHRRQKADACGNASQQFEIADHRSPAEVAARLKMLGLDPIWKDGDQALVNASCG